LHKSNTHRKGQEIVPYLVTEDCIKCKYMDCVEVCPVDCFYEGENMLVISPVECIDCGLCEPECPATAIVSAAQGDFARWAKINEEYSLKWPSITSKGEELPNSKEHEGEKDKFQKYFSPKPAAR
jgi:ferredoxin